MRAFNVPSVRQGRSITTMFYIHAVFIICLIPFVLTLIYYIATHQNQAVFDSIPVFCTGTLVFTSSTINPYLYCWRMGDIRKAVKKLLNGVKCHAQ
jgi:RsiW-degrading membrane proteinase PrsW (M82 family)